MSLRAIAWQSRPPCLMDYALTLCTATGLLHSFPVRNNKVLFVIHLAPLQFLFQLVQTRILIYQYILDPGHFGEVL